MLIEDKDNPTGMFSKAGRLSIEMFSLLQEKETILTNKQKVFHPKSTLNEKLSQKNKSQTAHELEILKKPAEDNMQLQKKTKSSQNALKLSQPFTKVVSREQIETLKDKQKVNNQKFGMYYPKYHFIYEKSPFYQDEDFLEEQRQNYLGMRNEIVKPKDKATLTLKNEKIKKMRLKKISSEDKFAESQQQAQLLNIVSEPNLFCDEVRCHVKFSKMGQRKPLIEGDGPHEKRFEYFELPQIYSKVHQPSNIYFQKARKGPNMFNLQQSGLQYDVNLEAIYPKSPKLVIKFEKSVPRQFPKRPIYTLDESVADTSMYKAPNQQLNVNSSQLTTKIPGPNFQSMLPREKKIINKITQSDSHFLLNSSIS